MKNNQTKFKETELGLIPEDWQVLKVKDLCLVKNGKTNSVDAKINGEYPLFDRSSEIKRSSKYLFDSEAIIIPGEGKEFPPVFYAGKFDLHQRAYAIMPNSKKISMIYLYYWLSCKKDWLSRIAVGSTVKSLRLDMLKDFIIGMPALTEQQKIAGVLGALDEKIELNRKMNKTLEQIAQAIFNRLYFNNPEYEDWNAKPLEDVFDFLEGPGIRNWQYADKGTKFINIRLINGGDIDVASASCINQNDVDTKYQHFLLREKDMVLSTSGSLGRSAIVRTSHLPLLLNTSVIRFRPKNNENYPFMYQYLNSNQFLNEQMSMASGSAQINFGPTHLKQMTLSVPPAEILTQISESLNPIYDQINNNLDSVETLSQIRDSLLPRLMSGKLRVV